MTARDIRFPTSRELHGSDAVNVDPDYSAAYVTLATDDGDGREGHGLAFTCGRGTEIVVLAIRAYAPLVQGRTLESIGADMRGFWRSLVGESQLRWLGPEKGAIHLAASALVNAVWDLWAKSAGKPLWKLLTDMPPEQLVDCIDFTYMSDALSPDEALAILQRNHATRAEREDEMLRTGFPAYTTSAGWLGYSEETVRSLCRAGVERGWTTFKMKVGAGLEQDVRRAAVIRDEIGFERRLMMDANQKWDVNEAIEHMGRLAEFDPWWIEEPTSPDDVLGHARIRAGISPIRVATGEHAQNRVIFKQLMQAKAIDFCQVDACRLAGVNEVVAVLLMAAKFGIPVCPHAGGVGLCEYTQHISLFDYICVAASLEDRVLEYVDHLHEHFVHPIVVRDGRYMPPQQPGYSIAMRESSLDRYEFPTGEEWSGAEPDGSSAR